MMKVFHIEDFKCTLCSNWFCPPFNLPYLLPCTHSICTHCLNRVSSIDDRIVCPEDLESCNVAQINLNTTTKKALERLMKQHKSYNQNTQLECIQSLSLSFGELLASRDKRVRNLQTLLDQVFNSQISRLKAIHDRLTQEIDRPRRIVEDWKEVVTLYLTSLRNNHNSDQSTQLFHYIEEGRKIKMELYEHSSYDLDLVARDILTDSTKCFSKNFTLWQDAYKKKGAENHSKVSAKRPDTQKQQASRLLRPEDSPAGNLNNTQAYCQTREAKNLMESAEGRRCMKDLPTLANDNIGMSLVADITGPVMLQKGKVTQLSQMKSEQSHSKPSPKEVDNFQALIGCGESNRKNSQHSPLKNPARGEFRRTEKQSNLSQFSLSNRVESWETSKGGQEGRANKENVFGFPEIHSSPSLVDQQINFLFEQDIPSENLQKTMVLPSPGIIREQYTEEAEEPSEELLLGSEREPLQVGSHNFLKEWQIKRQQPEHELEVRQKGYYNCERQKISYMRKMQLVRAQEVYEMTIKKDDYIQLMNQSLHDIDMSLFLAQFDWSGISIIKLVKTSITDEQLNTLLNYIVNLKVQTLVLSGNHLSDHSLDAFLNFVNLNTSLKSVCLAKNYINALKARPKLNLLRERGIIIYM